MNIKHFLIKKGYSLVPDCYAILLLNFNSKFSLSYVTHSTNSSTSNKNKIIGKVMAIN